MPTKDGVGRDDRCDLGEGPATDGLASNRESTPLVVSQPQSSATELLLQDTVFFSEVFDHRILPARDPAGHGGDQDLPGVKGCCHSLMMTNPKDNRQLFPAVETG